MKTLWPLFFQTVLVLGCVTVVAGCQTTTGSGGEDAVSAKDVVVVSDGSSVDLGGAGGCNNPATDCKGAGPVNCPGAWACDTKNQCAFRCTDQPNCLYYPDGRKICTPLPMDSGSQDNQPVEVGPQDTGLQDQPPVDAGPTKCTIQDLGECNKSAKGWECKCTSGSSSSTCSTPIADNCEELLYSCCGMVADIGAYDGGPDIPVPDTGQPCVSACECPKGWGCSEGKCVTSASCGPPVIFCCGRCPMAGCQCVWPNDAPGTCEAPVDAGPQDMGLPDGATRCKNACDCQPNWGCRNDICTSSTEIPGTVVCCDKPCPSGATCIHADGGRSTCPGDADVGPPGG